MANSFKDYTGDGVTVAFTTPPYLDSTHIKVKVDGVIQSTNDYSISGTTLTFDTAPANATRVHVFRETSQDVRLTDYADASVLKADDLDLDSNQLFYLAQEALEKGESEEGLTVPETLYADNVTSTGDIEILGNLAGLVLVDIAGTRHRVRVNTNGTLYTDEL